MKQRLRKRSLSKERSLQRRKRPLFKRRKRGKQNLIRHQRLPMQKLQRLKLLQRRLRLSLML